jgi:hypothetical protein
VVGAMGLGWGCYQLEHEGKVSAKANTEMGASQMQNSTNKSSKPVVSSTVKAPMPQQQHHWGCPVEDGVSHEGTRHSDSVPICVIGPITQYSTAATHVTDTEPMCMHRLTFCLLPVWHMQHVLVLPICCLVVIIVHQHSARQVEALQQLERGQCYYGLQVLACSILLSAPQNKPGCHMALDLAVADIPYMLCQDQVAIVYVVAWGAWCSEAVKLLVSLCGV